jgi:hypothetical protein
MDIIPDSQLGRNMEIGLLIKKIEIACGQYGAGCVELSVVTDLAKQLIELTT